MALLAVFAASSPALAQDEDSYTPAFDVGSGDDDWWTVYPDQHENASLPVKHPDWVLDELKEKPLLILIHSNNCLPCLIQVPRIESAVARFGENLSYHDVVAEGAGYLEALDILDVYDPDGGAQYVPTTIFITLAEDTDGSVDVAWHSQPDIMSQEDIDSYVEDSIYYHQMNRDSWEQG
ncbi:MAG: TlpA family protein disulfide reductase [Methanothrix sp.]